MVKKFKTLITSFFLGKDVNNLYLSFTPKEKLISLV